MKTRDEILELMVLNSKDIEAAIGMKITNGRGLIVARKTLRWVLGREED